MVRFQNILIGCVCCLVFACSSPDETPETALDAGRAFISAIYNGNFKRAGQLIVQDDTNRNLLETHIEKDFRSRDGWQKDALSKASIQILEIETKPAGITRMHFLNAYNGKRAYIDVVEQNGTYGVDVSSFKP